MIILNFRRYFDITKVIAVIFIFSMFTLSLVAEESIVSKKVDKKIDNIGFINLWTSEKNYTVSELIELFTHGDSFQRQFSVLHLSELEIYGEKEIRILIEALEDKNEKVRLQAMAGLMRMGEPVTELLVEALEESTPIFKFGYSSKALNGWRSFSIRKSDLVFTVLVNMDSVNIEYLIKVYPTVSDKIKEEILYIISKSSLRLNSVIYHAIRNGEVRLAKTLINMLGRAKSDAVDVIPLLMEVIENREDTLHEEAIYTLSKIPKYGVKILKKLLNHQNVNIRRIALSFYPSNANDVGQVITKRIKDSNLEIQQEALSRIQNLNYGIRYSYCSENSSSSSLISFPNSIITDLADILEDTNISINILTIKALGSLGCAKNKLIVPIVDILMNQISNPSNRVKTEVIEQLDRLSHIDVFPIKSSYNLEEIFSQLSRLEFNQKIQLLQVLDKMKLLNQSNKIIIDIFVKRLYNDIHENQRVVNSILLSNPILGDNIIKIIVKDYPNLKSLNKKTLLSVNRLPLSTPLYVQTLQKFLSHYDKSIQIPVAIHLSELGINNNLVMDILEESVKSSEKYIAIRRFANTAIERLANMGSVGIERILVIADESKTSLERRKKIYSELLRVVDKHPVLIDKFLSMATVETPLQRIIVSNLSFIRILPIEVQKTFLLKAFSSKDEEVREAVVNSWIKLNLPAEIIIDQVFSDSALSVRRNIFELVKKISKSDYRRITITRSAINGKNQYLREEGLIFAGKMGNHDGENLLIEYAKVLKNPLSYDFFRAIEEMEKITPTLIAVLEMRIKSELLETQIQINKVLGKSGTCKTVDCKRLYEQLQVSSGIERKSAAETLVALNENPWDKKGLIAYVLMDDKVRKIIKDRLGKTLDILYPSIFRNISASRSNLPEFPWPPPYGYSRILVPHNLMSLGAKSTLGDVYKVLVDSLEKASDGFEYGLFKGVPKGFALVARMERIKKDGTPFPESVRWLNQGSPKVSFSDFLGDLFFERPGYFRIIVFVVTDDFSFTRRNNRNTDAEVPLPNRGAPFIPDELAIKRLEKQKVIALIYTFKRSHNAKVTYWKDGVPSAKQHLKQSGIWMNFSK